MKRAFKYRFCPTDAQAAELVRTFGCVRLVYNKALEARADAWGREQRRVTYNDTSAMFTVWKKSDELAFLSEVSSVPLQQALRHLQNAFRNFLANRARHPRFKSRKKSRASDSAGRWFVSILVETNVDHHAPADAAVGIDAGVTALVTLSTGEKITNPRHEQRDRQRLARAMRTLARKGGDLPTGTRRAARWHVYMPASPTGDAISCTSSALDSSVRIKRS
ncbi:RNA-guided endonuclease InsQ/TnpB family protein [Lentzea miocenica]|uniref:RNA-guided endonuclease InsQ/TnpB family protein n=1 Tax=Lentzea miocenica TaxID=3095431 RepID=UPI003872C3FA